MENYCLLSNPAMVRHIKESLDSLSSGKAIACTLDELKKMEEEE